MILLAVIIILAIAAFILFKKTDIQHKARSEADNLVYIQKVFNEHYTPTALLEYYRSF